MDSTVITPNEGEIKISTFAEKKTSSQESSNQDSTNLKLKRCKHGRIIIKDPSKKKQHDLQQQGDNKDYNELDAKTNKNITPDINTDQKDSDQRQSLEVDHNQSTTEVAGDKLVVDETQENKCTANEQSCEAKERGSEVAVIKPTENNIKAPPKNKTYRSRSRSRSPSRRRVNSRSPPHRKSPRRHRGRSPRRGHSSRSPSRRDRRRSPWSSNKTSSSRKLSSRRNSRRSSPRRSRRSTSNHRRNRQSSRNKSPRRRSRSQSSSRSRSRSLTPPRQSRSEVFAFQKASDGPKNLQNQSQISIRAGDSTNFPKTSKSAQPEIDDPKKSLSARSSMSPYSANSISSDIYDPEGPIIPISPGDSPPLPSPINQAASNNNNNDDDDKISYQYDGDRNDDDVPSSAVQLNQQEKYLQKLNRQERVVEEVKIALKPHYHKRAINKEQYKDVLRRAVPKICHSKNGEINPVKIRGLVDAYVKKMKRHK